MQVNNLSGAALDYWVARAEGIEHGPELREMRPGNVLVKVWDREHGFTFYTSFTPSTDPAQAWPIIERNRLTVLPRDTGKGWWARVEYVWYKGDTFLVAAMRAYVAHRFGATVPAEVPA